MPRKETHVEGLRYEELTSCTYMYLTLLAVKSYTLHHCAWLCATSRNHDSVILCGELWALLLSCFTSASDSPNALNTWRLSISTSLDHNNNWIFIVAEIESSNLLSLEEPTVP